MFRVKYPLFNAAIKDNETIQKEFDKTPGMRESNRATRVHNDHLELLLEIGLVGYGLFIALIAQIPLSPIMFGLVIAFGINACFFFPLREAHTALPFWAILGACAFTPVASVPLSPIILGAVVLLLGAIVMKATNRGLGAFWFYQSTFPAFSQEQRVFCIRKALGFSPKSTIYLDALAVEIAAENTEEAFDCVSRAIYQFDGDKMLYALLNNWGKIGFVLGGLRIGRDGTRKSDALVSNKQAEEFNKEMDELDKVMAEAGGSSIVG
jgi:hypothetical protein